MSVGLPVSKSEIDTRVGDLARAFQRNFEQVDMIKSYMDATPDPTLVALGYTAPEIAVIKTAVNDLAQLKTVWEGSSILAVAKNFTTFVRQLWGVGAF